MNNTLYTLGYQEPTNPDFHPVHVRGLLERRKGARERESRVRPMQIDTHPRDGTQLTDQVGYKQWLLPAASGNGSLTEL